MLEELINKLSKKENLVFVGSVAMKYQGIDVTPKDIDIVVTDLSGLNNYTEYTTDSKFSLSGKRAFIKGDISVDIFVEVKLPHFNVIEGIKCESLHSMKRYYESIYNSVDEHWKKVINDKLKYLGNNEQKY